MPGTTTTVQLRRYVIRPGHFDAYVQWWNGSIRDLRLQYGFVIEAAYADRPNSQFVWSLAIAGDKDEFARVEAEYMASPERAVAFEGIPDWIESSVVSLVESQPLERGAA